MRDFYCKIIRELEEEIGIRYIDNGDQISLCESMIEITLQKLTKLKRFINENEFKTIEDEIIFFKELKPKIVSKLIYYNSPQQRNCTRTCLLIQRFILVLSVVASILLWTSYTNAQ